MLMHGGLAPPGSARGVPALAGLVQRLALQFDITVYMLQGTEQPTAPFAHGRAAVRSVPARHGAHMSLKVLHLTRALLADHRKNPFTLVHGFWALPGGFSAVLAGRLAHIPAVVSLLGGEAAYLPGIGYGNMRKTGPRAATLWACRASDALIALTRYQLEQLSRFGFSRQDGVHLVPFGAEAPFSLSGTPEPPAPPFHILHVGDLNRVKDQRTLLNAFRLIRGQKDCRLRIVGEDTLGGEMQRYAGELGISDSVTFAGFVPHDSLGPHFAWAHLLLHASLYEGQGVVFAEAAAAGLPICGTRVGLLADLGEHFAATAEPGDHEGLSRAALRLLGDASLRKSLAAGARTWAGEHDADRTAELVARVYGSLPTGYNRRPSSRKNRAITGVRVECKPRIGSPSNGKTANL